MMRKIFLLLVICCLLLTGCGKPQRNKPEISVTDSLGNTVSLPEKPQKVAVLFSSFAQIWQLAGGEVAVTVGESVERGFVPKGTPLVDDGAGKSIDIERLLAEKPDFVIGSADIPAQVMACETLAKQGVPVALFRVDDFSQYLTVLKTCAEITGNEDAYETYGNQVKENVDTVLSAKKGQSPKKILFIRAGSTYAATKAKRAPENFVCTMLSQLGAVNIADSASVLLDGLSLEEILLQDPDHIFLVAMGNEDAAKDYIGNLFESDGWKDLTAVKTGNYTFLDRELFHFKPNHRWAEAYKQLFNLLYPESDYEG